MHEHTSTLLLEMCYFIFLVIKVNFQRIKVLNILNDQRKCTFESWAACSFQDYEIMCIGSQA